MATKTVSMGMATIGPASWRNNTLKEIQSSQAAVRRADKSCEMGRSMDPLPNLRDVVASLSNDEAHRYFRQTRAVVCLLRESMIDTNEEIKSLTRGKESLEKALDHIRKDIKLNSECVEIRSSRPQREKDHDGAHDLLHAERLHLYNLKKKLENQLYLVQQQLQALDSARKRLSATIQERSVVLDLISHAMPSGSQSAGVWTSRGNTTASFGGSRNGGFWSSRSSSSLGKSRGSFGADREGAPQIDPLGPYTPECDAALNEARDARARSAMLRRDAQDAIGRSSGVQKMAHQSVNSGLVGKTAETVGLKQSLDIAAAENKHAVQRAQRWFDSTERAWGYSRGPVVSSDLSSREKLDRPIIRVFQRHPGTNLPEAQEIVKGGDGLLESLRGTARNIGVMKLAHLRLKDDIRDKSSAIDIDSSVIRLRRRKANHRWAMGAAF